MLGHNPTTTHLPEGRMTGCFALKSTRAPSSSHYCKGQLPSSFLSGSPQMWPHSHPSCKPLSMLFPTPGMPLPSFSESPDPLLACEAHQLKCHLFQEVFLGSSLPKVPLFPHLSSSVPVYLLLPLYHLCPPGVLAWAVCPPRSPPCTWHHAGQGEEGHLSLGTLGCRSTSFSAPRC